MEQTGLLHCGFWVNLSNRSTSTQYWNKNVFNRALEYLMDVEKLNLSAIRTVRVLRPLKAINRIPSMRLERGWRCVRYLIHSVCRILVMLLLDTLPMLGNVLLLCFFVFFIFGIVGVQLWAGLLRQRCYVRWGQWLLLILLFSSRTLIHPNISDKYLQDWITKPGFNK